MGEEQEYMNMVDRWKAQVQEYVNAGFTQEQAELLTNKFNELSPI